MACGTEQLGSQDVGKEGGGDVLKLKDNLLSHLSGLVSVSICGPNSSKDSEEL